MLYCEQYKLTKIKMDLSIFVAKVLSVMYLSFGLAAVGNRIDFSKMMDSFEKSQGLTMVAGFVTLVMGMLLVEVHNLWVKDWRVIITIFAWAATFKGVMLLAFPQTIHAFKGSFKSAKVKNIGYLSVVLGLLLANLGFGGLI